MNAEAVPGTAHRRRSYVNRVRIMALELSASFGIKQHVIVGDHQPIMPAAELITAVLST
jgi:hypothetical protein